MRHDDSYMQERDIVSLRYFGFEPGFSGSSWFGVDKEGQMWQAITDFSDGLLHFRRYYANKGTDGAKPMTKDKFMKTFKVLHD